MNRPKGRAMTPKGEMSSSGSGPAIMMMPPHIRATFMPNPPPKPLPVPLKRRSKEAWYRCHVDNNTSNTSSSSNTKQQALVGLSGVAAYMTQFERTLKQHQLEENKRLAAATTTPTAITSTTALITPSEFKRIKAEHKEKMNRERLEPLIEQYLAEKKASRGEYEGMNCYKTLFVARLAYEVTERKLLREFETHGSIKDIKVIYHRQPSLLSSEDDPQQQATINKKSRGYAFIEYDREEDMKRAYKYADAMRIDGRAIVVDVERGHTVPNFLPRRLGGGLGATRAAGKPPGAMIPGRYDPNALRSRMLVPSQQQQQPSMQQPPPAPMMGGYPTAPSPHSHYGYHPPHDNRGPPPPGYRDGPPPHYGYDNRGPPPPFGGGGGDRYGPPQPYYSGGRGGGPPLFGGRGRGPPDRSSNSQHLLKRGRSPSPPQSRGRYRH